MPKNVLRKPRDSSLSQPRERWNCGPGNCQRSTQAITRWRRTTEMDGSITVSANIRSSISSRAESKLLKIKTSMRPSTGRMIPGTTLKPPMTSTTNLHRVSGLQTCQASARACMRINYSSFDCHASWRVSLHSLSIFPRTTSTSTSSGPRQVCASFIIQSKKHASTTRTA